MGLLWGQWTLFLYVRLQDDLLDGDIEDLRTQFLADRILVESLEAFQTAPGLGSGFWDAFRTCLRDTVEGILEVGMLEREPGRFTAAELPLHARVSAIFKVGSAAVCHQRDRVQDLVWVSEVQDRLAVLGQLFDDFKDVTSDLEGGRYTFPGNVLLDAKPGERIGPQERDQRLGEGFLRPSRAEPIWSEIDRAGAGALEALPDSAPEAVRGLVRSYLSVAEETEALVHRQRARRLFANVDGIDRILSGAD